MGAVAAATKRIAVGSLVARATLRPPAVLANGFDTLARILGPERLLVAIGAGDGAEPGGERDLRARLRHGGRARRRARATRSTPRATGGTRCGSAARDPAVREVAAAHADGWNRWGAGLERFRSQAANLPAAAARAPFTVSWGGLVVLGDDDDAAAAKAERLGAGDHVHRRRPRAGGRRAPRVRRRRRRVADDRSRRLRPIPTTRGSWARRFCPGCAEGPTRVRRRGRWSSAGSTRCRRTSSRSSTP